MGNVIRYISGEEGNHLGLPSSYYRPLKKHSDNPRQELSSEENNSKDLPRILDPHRAKFLQVIHPALRQLRASKLPPKERAEVKKGLLEQFLYMAESKPEG